MFKTITTVFGAALLMTVSVWSADANSTQGNGSPIDQFRTELRNVQTYANEVANVSKQKNATADEVKPKADLLAESIRRLRALAVEHSDNLGIAGDKQRQTVSVATEVMEIILNNKLKLLEEEGFSKNRNLVRAKAAGIVERVKIIEKNLGDSRS